MTRQATAERIAKALHERDRAYIEALAEAYVLADTTEAESKLDDLLYEAGEALGLDAQDFTDLAAKKWGVRK